MKNSAKEQDLGIAKCYVLIYNGECHEKQMMHLKAWRGGKRKVWMRKRTVKLSGHVSEFLWCKAAGRHEKIIRKKYMAKCICKNIIRKISQKEQEA
ncbi:hypothetical protein BRYFOR_06557 [Marvinbryantia formatexigens DSM 14469]|uniref:Uncharacterized protein n=1 Tax=Marvinbryantia formatexigens DSM 14469 TaxID=478749 RepID=C6LDE7_9FIRM|nr:hypothetical protein [Marvinbryantia formatexigens]EET61382.1 hypothetical protein BRYFOR_06557 [Marvinbryantia formatexigens DSM 14469]UWO26058.1 hypothetical protein NQ534_06210 [Marvinbryantia formatexigens DSM 14469]